METQSTQENIIADFILDVLKNEPQIDNNFDVYTERLKIKGIVINENELKRIINNLHELEFVKYTISFNPSPEHRNLKIIKGGLELLNTYGSYSNYLKAIQREQNRKGIKFYWSFIKSLIPIFKTFY